MAATGAFLGRDVSVEHDAQIERLDRLPGTSVNVLDTIGPYTKPGGAAVPLAVVAGFLGVQVFGTGVQRAEAAGAAQFRPLAPVVGAAGGEPEALRRATVRR